jgi:hypothetical protein
VSKNRGFAALCKKKKPTSRNYLQYHQVPVWTVPTTQVLGKYFFRVLLESTQGILSEKSAGLETNFSVHNKKINKGKLVKSISTNLDFLYKLPFLSQIEKNITTCQINILFKKNQKKPPDPSIIYKKLWRLIKKNHNNKSSFWIVKKYWLKINYHKFAFVNKKKFMTMITKVSSFKKFEKKKKPFSIFFIILTKTR